MRIFPHYPLMEESGEGSAGMLPEGTSEGQEWYLSEGVKGEGPAPDYYNSGKYKTLADQAKAQRELEKRLGGFTGAPESYAINIPETINGVEIDPESEGVQDILNYAKEQGASQEFMDKMLTFHAEAMASIMPNIEAEIERLGKDGQDRLKNIADWGKANLTEDQYSGMQMIANSAEAIEFIEAMIGLTKTTQIPGKSTPAPGLTPDKVRAMKFEKTEDGRMRYQVDADHKAQVDAAYKELYGTGPAADEIVR